MIVVTGMHRSGTTFLGELLHVALPVSYLHEPFNRVYGVEGVDRWYPYVPLEQESGPWVDLLDRLRRTDIRFKSVVNPDDTPLRRALRPVLKSRGNIDLYRLRILRILRMRQRALVKDPFMSMCAANLARRHADVKVVYVVRHPVAVYESVKRMSWDIDLESILGQPGLAQLLGAEVHARASVASSMPERIAALWMILNTVIQKQMQDSSRAILVRHEDLSTEPYREVERVLSFLGATMHERVRAHIEKTMFASAVVATPGVLHEMKRNAAALAYSWKQNPKPEHAAIIDFCAPVLRNFYPEN